MKLAIMMYRIFCVLLVVIAGIHFSCSTPSRINYNNESKSIFKADTTPKLVSRQFAFTEGPAADKEGNVYFTDQPNNTIWKYNTNGTLSLFMTNAGRSNGLYFDNEGNLIACADENNQLWRIDMKGNVTILLDKYAGKRLNGPNDVWVHPSGDLYFTDPYYQRPYWTHQQPELAAQKVYRVIKGKREVQPVIENLRQPNGIIGSPDGRWLYVADIGAGKTYKCSINADGNLNKGELFCEMGSDGMTLDAKGNLYLTGNGVTIFNSKGAQIGHVPIPEKWTSNVTFGGKNRQQLFITASEAVYVLDMNVQGGH